MLNTKLSKVLFLFGLCLIGAGVYLSIWAERRANQLLGPTILRRNIHGDIWILANNRLHRLDDAGNLKRAFDPSELGINDLTDFVPLDSGELFIGDKETNEIRRYSQEGTFLRSFVVREKSAKFHQGNFRFTVDPETGDYYVADPTNHRILRFDKDGAPKGQFGQKGSGENDLHFPNQVAFGPDGLLYIVDTNNHRISVRTKDGINQRSIPTAMSRDRADHIWPTYLGFFDSSRLAVINKGPALVGGEITIVSMDEGLQQVILPAGADPSDILIRNEDFLVTEKATMQVLRFSHGGTRLGIFGDMTFTRLLSDAFLERRYFQAIVRNSRRGLLAVLFILLILLFIERYRTTRRAVKEDRLRDRVALKELPFEKMQPIKKWAYYGTFLGMFYMAMKYSAEIFAPQSRAKSSSLIMELIYLLAIVLFFFLSIFILRIGVKRGFLRGDQIKAQQKALKKFGPVLDKALMPQEKITMVSIARRLPRGFEALLRSSLIGHEMLFLVVTDSRILLLSTDVLFTRIRRIREIGYDGIRETKIGPKTFLQKWVSRMAGAEQLTLTPHGSRPPIELQAPSAKYAEELKQEIERCKAGARASVARFRELCQNCYSQILISQVVCPRCRKKTRKLSPAMLSLFFPGLGQFYNHAILKGTVFLVLGTVSLYIVLIQFYAWYQGTAEVRLDVAVRSATLLLVYWVASVTEAYYASKGSF